MEMLIRDAVKIVNCAAWRMFAAQCEISYPGSFCADLIRIFAPDIKSAKLLYKGKREQLAIACSEWGQSMVEIFYSENHRPIPIEPVNQLGNNCMSFSNQPIVTTASMQIGEMRLSPEILDIFTRWIQNPQIKGGIIRVTDERQVVMTQASAAICKGTLEEACRRKRSDYWHLPSLEAMRRFTQQQGTFEFSWYGTLKRPEGFPKFTSRYWTIEDQLGTVYQVSENLDFDLVKTLPLAV